MLSEPTASSEMCGRAAADVFGWFLLPQLPCKSGQSPWVIITAKATIVELPFNSWSLSPCFQTVFENFGKEWFISIPISSLLFLHSIGDGLRPFLLIWNYNSECLSLWHRDQQLLALCWLPAIPAMCFPAAFQEFVFLRHLQANIFWDF